MTGGAAVSESFMRAALALAAVAISLLVALAAGEVMVRLLFGSPMEERLDPHNDIRWNCCLR